jgi:hypothetical protein
MTRVLLHEQVTGISASSLTCESPLVNCRSIEPLAPQVEVQRHLDGQCRCAEVKLRHVLRAGMTTS